MAFGYGYWLPLSGKAIKTNEHGSSVIEKPERFGLTRKDIDKLLAGTHYGTQDTSKESGRAKVLIAAMKNGWIRIRGSGPQWSVQFYGNPAKAVKKAAKFLENEAGMFSNISVSDLGSGVSTSMSLKDLEQAVADGQFDVATTQDEEAAASGDETAKDKIRVPNTANRDQSVRSALRSRLERRLGPNAFVPEGWEEYRGGLLLEGMAKYQELLVTDQVIGLDIRG